jgi:exonuclease III
VGHHWIKVETFDGMFTRLSGKSDIPRILCGDFGSPQLERDGEIVTRGQDVGSDGLETPPPGNGCWDTGERSVLQGLATDDLADAFRRPHPDEEEYSWVRRGRGRGGAKKKVRRRYDHVFASEMLGVVDCRYVHAVREEGLSDHSAILAAFEPRLRAGCT